MESVVPEDLCTGLEHGGGLSWIETDEPWSAGRQYQPAKRRAAGAWHIPDSASAEPIFRPDSRVVLDWRAHDSTPSAAAAVSTFYDGGVLPQQRWSFDVPFTAV